MKFFINCETCRKKRLWFRVKKQKIVLPIGEIATSKKLMCDRCIKTIKTALKMSESKI